MGPCLRGETRGLHVKRIVRRSGPDRPTDSTITAERHRKTRKAYYGKRQGGEALRRRRAATAAHKCYNELPMTKPNDKLRRLLSCSFALLALAIIAATALYPRLDWKLAGAENAVPAPGLSPQKWLSGEIQAQTEPWLARRFGVRGFALRTANQLNYSVFHRKPANTSVVFGKDGWLYEKGYFTYYQERHPLKRPKQAKQFAGQMAALRDRLSERGIPLVVVVSPSKLEIYPEHLPDGIAPSDEALTRTPGYIQVIEALKAAGIPIVDAHALLLDWKNDGIPLFPKTGTHWNSYAAQKCMAEAWRTARAEESGKGLPPFPEVTGSEDRSPIGADTDLGDLLNFIHSPGSGEKVPYPVLAQTESGKRARVLMVGDSFTFQLVDAMGRSGCVADVKLLYYFRGIYDFRWKEGETPVFNNPEDFRTGSVDHKKIDYNELVADKDIVVVEFNEIYARNFAWGFADFASTGLR